MTGVSISFCFFPSAAPACLGDEEQICEIILKLAFVLWLLPLITESYQGSVHS